MEREKIEIAKKLASIYPFSADEIHTAMIALDAAIAEGVSPVIIAKEMSALKIDLNTSLGALFKDELFDGDRIKGITNVVNTIVSYHELKSDIAKVNNQ